jgi:formylglycine-generating enzyme required for sulfatase activity
VACGGAAATLYPYGATYQAHACNGLDHAVGAPVPVGSMATCAGGDPGIFDMSGNLREWTSEQAGTTGPPENKPIYVVRGGAYHTPAPGLTCSFGFSLAVVDLALPAIGFRCCSDSPP